VSTTGRGGTADRAGRAPRPGAALRLLLLPAALAAATAAGAAAGAGLSGRLEQALGAPGLAGARTAALVVDRASGEVLFARDPDRPLVPASNLKVLTGVAALAALGPAHRFRTEVLAPGPPDAAGAVAALHVRGGGDPALTSEQWWRLAADLRLRGLRRVRGDLVVDDTLFDDERWHPDWGDVSSRAYHAPVGALSANYGAFRVSVAPGAPGAPARVALDPPVDYLRLRAEVTTRAEGATDLRIARVPEAEAERVVVSGVIRAGSEPEDLYRSVADPARYAAAVLRLQLEANGIRVEGGTRLAPVPAGAVTLLEFEGIPLAEIARRFLKYSNNPIAESLLKSLAVAGGARGSFAGGVAAERRVLSGLGLDLDGTTLVDGSGLSRSNRVSVRLLVSALRAADRSFDFAPEIVGAVPIAGRDGTLERRAGAAAGRVRAKTGLLSGVTGLAGFARDAAGRDLVFSVLANDYRAGDRAAMDALDGFAAALVR
jgi:D-alanyl-D-alanine carboxypeptidase/D-alanyl-D-alanine-endopeptidase (penicillin-binding protein 4)